MLNKILLKSRNQKFESMSTLNRPTAGNGIIVYNSKQASESQKVSIVSSTHSVVTVASGPCGQTPSVKRQLSPARSLCTSANHNSPISSICASSLSLRAQTSIPTSKLRYSVQSSEQAKRHPSQVNSEDIAQESPVMTTPQPNKYKIFEPSSYSGTRVAVNLNEMSEFQDSSSRQGIQQQEQQMKDENIARKEKDNNLKIRGLESQVTLLVSELDKQTILSNSVLYDNTLFRRKYQELKESGSKQGQLNASDHESKESPSDLQILEIIEQNQKMRKKIVETQSEVKQWRDKYEKLDRQYEEHEERFKEKLTDQYEKEIAALNNELNKFKAQSFGINKFKKAISFIKASPLVSANNNSSLSKENANNNPNSQDDWHSNYMQLKEEKDKNEKALKRKIESLQEQNAFLQTEVSQLHKQETVSSTPKSTLQNQLNTTPPNLHNNIFIPLNKKNNNLNELNFYFTSNMH